MPTVETTEPSGTARTDPSRSDRPEPRLLLRLGTWPVVLASGVALLLAAVLLFASSAPFAIPTVEHACGEAPLDVRTRTSAEEVHEFLVACGPNGREAYRDLQRADLLYPLLVGLFLTSTLALVLRRLAPRRPQIVRLAWLGLLVTALDHLENLFARQALAAFPEPSSTDALLGLASLAKTSVSWLVWSLLLAALLALAARRLVVRSRASNQAGARSQ